MELILYRDFVDRFVKGITNFKIDLVDDYFEFLSQLRKVKVVTDLTIEEIEFEIKINDNILLEHLIELAPEIVTIRRPSSAGVFSLIFSEDYDIRNEALSKGYDCISSDNFNERWFIYSGSRPDKCMKVAASKEINEMLCFDNYRKLKNFNHPVHSILIFDLYILVDASIGRIQDNLFPLLANMLQYSSKKTIIDLMIITKFDKNYPDDIKNKHAIVSDFIKCEFANQTIHLSLVDYHKDYTPSQASALNFRRIYTNYFQIKSEKSFTYFKRDGKINFVSDIEFNFVFQKPVPDFLEFELQQIKYYIKNLPEFRPFALGRNKLLYYPDKENRLLN